MLQLRHTKFDSQLQALTFILTQENALHKGFLVEFMATVGDLFSRVSLEQDANGQYSDDASLVAGAMVEVLSDNPKYGVYTVDTERDGIAYVAGYIILVSDGITVTRAFALTWPHRPH